MRSNPRLEPRVSVVPSVRQVHEVHTVAPNCQLRGKAGGVRGTSEDAAAECPDRSLPESTKGHQLAGEIARYSPWLCRSSDVVRRAAVTVVGAAQVSPTERRWAADEGDPHPSRISRIDCGWGLLQGPGASRGLGDRLNVGAGPRLARRLRPRLRRPTPTGAPTPERRATRRPEGPRRSAYRGRHSARACRPTRRRSPSDSLHARDTSAKSTHPRRRPPSPGGTQHLLCACRAELHAGRSIGARADEAPCEPRAQQRCRDCELGPSERWSQRPSSWRLSCNAAPAGPLASVP